MIKAVLKKPLDGKAEGDTVEFNKTDFEMLEGLGAVVRAPDDEPVTETEASPPVVPSKADAAAANKMDIASVNKAAKTAANKAAQAG